MPEMAQSCYVNELFYGHLLELNKTLLPTTGKRYSNITSG